jgi:hypothetical protein
MESITIEILNPKASQLIQDLADMKLITICKTEDNTTKFSKKLPRRHSSFKEVSSIEEITKELELEREKHQSDSDVVQEKTEFQHFLLQGPVMTNTQYAEFKENRKRLNKWRSK